MILKPRPSLDPTYNQQHTPSPGARLLEICMTGGLVIPLFVCPGINSVNELLLRCLQLIQLLFQCDRSLIFQIILRLPLLRLSLLHFSPQVVPHSDQLVHLLIPVDREVPNRCQVLSGLQGQQVEIEKTMAKGNNRRIKQTCM